MVPKSLSSWQLSWEFSRSFQWEAARSEGGNPSKALDTYLAMSSPGSLVVTLSPLPLSHVLGGEGRGRESKTCIALSGSLHVSGPLFPHICKMGSFSQQTDVSSCFPFLCLGKANSRWGGYPHFHSCKLFLAVVCRQQEVLDPLGQ